MKRRDFVGLATAAAVPVISRTAFAAGAPRRDDTVLMYWLGSEALDDLRAAPGDVPAHEWVPARRMLMGDGRFRQLDAHVSVIGLRGRADESLSLDVVFPAKGMAARPSFHAWHHAADGASTSASIGFDLPLDQEGAAVFVLTRDAAGAAPLASSIRLTTCAMNNCGRLRRGVYALGFGPNPTRNHVVLTVDYARPSLEQKV